MGKNRLEALRDGVPAIIMVLWLAYAEAIGAFFPPTLGGRCQARAG